MSWLPYAIRDTRTERLLRDYVQGLGARTLLDYGCGHGVRTEAISHYMGGAERIALFEPDPALLQSALARLPAARPWDLRGTFDLLLCFSVLEILPDNEIDDVLARLAGAMHPQSVMLVQHVNWHPLAYRTLYWWLKSGFRSAARAHAQANFPRNYGRLAALVSRFTAAGLHVTHRIRGPYLDRGRHIHLPVPDAMRAFNIFALRRK